MVIDKNWRVLTIGDGDLSFSASIARYVSPKLLVATVFDERASLVEKYSDKFLHALTTFEITVLSKFDVTNSASWGALTQNSFDLVIFQFPLVPNDVSFKQHQDNQSIGSSNTINRWLLHSYLANCFEHFLAKDGQRLAVITSKDVKPYRQWNIETSIINNLACDYIGQCDFNFDNYPGYQIRNVDRDKFVKETQAISYFYSDKPQQALSKQLTIPTYCHDDKFCSICRVGPINTPLDWENHRMSKRHIQMSQYEEQWLQLLNKS